MLQERKARDAEEKAKELKAKERIVPVDSLVVFRQLRGKNVVDDLISDDYDLQRATGQADLDKDTDKRFLKLHQVIAYCCIVRLYW